MTRFHWLHVFTKTRYIENVIELLALACCDMLLGIQGIKVPVLLIHLHLQVKMINMQKHNQGKHKGVVGKRGQEKRKFDNNGVRYDQTSSKRIVEDFHKFGDPPT